MAPNVLSINSYSSKPPDWHPATLFTRGLPTLLNLITVCHALTLSPHQLNNKLLQAIPFWKLNRKQPSRKFPSSNNFPAKQSKQKNFQMVMPHSENEWWWQLWQVNEQMTRTALPPQEPICEQLNHPCNDKQQQGLSNSYWHNNWVSPSLEHLWLTVASHDMFMMKPTVRTPHTANTELWPHIQPEIKKVGQAITGKPSTF
jgi:hypothetical protein